MQTEALIPAEIFCTHYNVEFAFIDSLYHSGLVEIVTIDETHFLKPDDLAKLEKLARLHYDLHINVEGIDTIIHLLSRMEDMQREVAILRSRLGLYEGGE